MAPGIAAWIAENVDQLFLSVMTIAEIEQGVRRLNRIGARRKAADLTGWLRSVSLLYQSRVLPFDLSVAAALGRLADDAISRGRPGEAADLIIAATAYVHGFTLVTRNIRHFAGLGVPLLDPYDPQGIQQ